MNPIETHDNATLAGTHAETGVAGHGAPVPFYQDASFWVALSIVIFAVLAWRAVRKMYIQATGKYADEVSRQLREARELKEQAEALLAQYKQKQQDGMKEAQQIAANAKSDAETLRGHAMDELKTLLRSREQQAMDKIDRAEAEIIKELRVKTADMAIEATQSILKEVLDSQRNAMLVDQAIREMPKQLH